MRYAVKYTDYEGDLGWVVVERYKTPNEVFKYYMSINYTILALYEISAEWEVETTLKKVSTCS